MQRDARGRQKRNTQCEVETSGTPKPSPTWDEQNLGMPKTGL